MISATKLKKLSMISLTLKYVLKRIIIFSFNVELIFLTLQLSMVVITFLYSVYFHLHTYARYMCISAYEYTRI